MDESITLGCHSPKIRRADKRRESRLFDCQRRPLVDVNGTTCPVISQSDRRPLSCTEAYNANALSTEDEQAVYKHDLMRKHVDSHQLPLHLHEPHQTFSVFSDNLMEQAFTTDDVKIIGSNEAIYETHACDFKSLLRPEVPSGYMAYYLSALSSLDDNPSNKVTRNATRRRRRTADFEIIQSAKAACLDNGTTLDGDSGQNHQTRRLRKSICIYKEQQKSASLLADQETRSGTTVCAEVSKKDGSCIESTHSEVNRPLAPEECDEDISSHSAATTFSINVAGLVGTVGAEAGSEMANVPGIEVQRQEYDSGQMKSSCLSNSVHVTEQHESIDASDKVLEVTPELRALYLNKNYAPPPINMLSTIFESPRKAKYGKVLFSKKGIKRAADISIDNYHRVSPYKLNRRRKLARLRGWKPMTAAEDKCADQLLQSFLEKCS